eukprot:CAMPEP_0181296546 /NCGR_PEP_ID=MMETSP1101-20121128/4763_1 /TAXON_ID=46948 /ORGANISM="Rhodomonas abbreviata, Strain Caron Lab Isolate" /LENGTH=120 /DNA_ID=CAMNT_0023401421 /DNA_START=1028 /DNA_END=1387 /DNA_ORIENTATION=-
MLVLAKLSVAPAERSNQCPLLFDHFMGIVCAHGLDSEGFVGCASLFTEIFMAMRIAPSAHLAFTKLFQGVAFPFCYMAQLKPSLGVGTAGCASLPTALLDGSGGSLWHHQLDFWGAAEQG